MNEICKCGHDIKLHYVNSGCAKCKCKKFKLKLDPLKNDKPIKEMINSYKSKGCGKFMGEMDCGQIYGNGTNKIALCPNCKNNSQKKSRLETPIKKQNSSGTLSDKIWNETMMVLASEDYVLDGLEDLKNAIMVFIGRTIIEKDKEKKEFIKKLKVNLANLQMKKGRIDKKFTFKDFTTEIDKLAGDELK